MGIYEQRTQPAYRAFAEESYCRNRHILKWWSPAHDQVLVEQIEKEQWMWYWETPDRIVEITSPETIDAWKNTDPICSKYAWNNILMYFSISRANSLGLTDRIREPIWKICPLCNQRFIEDSLPFPLVKRLGVDHLDFCAPCLSQTIFQGSDTLSEESALAYIQDLAALLQRVPSQDFGGGIGDLWDLGFEERLALLNLFQQKPTVRRIKELFGSWLGALIAAGVLEDGTRRTSRGTQCLAKDGHVCLSLGEKTIDDFLYAQGVIHEKEPPYPEGNYRADFLVGDVFVEYFGLKGNPDYDAKTRLKKRICKRHGIRLISIYPSELISVKKLSSKLAEFA